MSNNQGGLAQAHQKVVDAVRMVAEETECPILTAGQTASMVVEGLHPTLEEARSLAGNDQGGHSRLAQLLISQGEFTPSHELKALTRGVRELSEERLPAIVERAQKALSSLQFCDPLDLVGRTRSKHQGISAR